MFERETIKTLRIKKADWQKKVATHYANNEQKLVKSSSHITIEPVYTPVEISDLSYEQDLGFPGEYPFTRGVDAS
ncbi:MAG: methylmalonyl-CoA mutase family protein, partial [Firmicutes bacterium]|nr:methylmalonyl-CoA mutase family protein [Bacillota bacterium]